MVRTGETDLVSTDYWIQLQLSVAGAQAIRVVAPPGGLQIAVRDVNGDDAPDLVLTTAWRDQPVAILLNDGHGTFSRIDPSRYPNAFTFTQTDWSSRDLTEPELLALLSKTHGVVEVRSIRLPHSGSYVGAPRGPNCCVVAAADLNPHSGRAPPLKFLASTI